MMTIDGEKLRILRQSMRCPQGVLAEYLGIPQPHLSQMEGGGRNVPESVMTNLSFMTGFAPSFLERALRTHVPTGSNRLYRKRRNKFRRTEEAQSYCQLIFEVFEPLTGQLKPRPCLLSSDAFSDPSEAAEIVRNALALRPGAAVKDLTFLAEKAGVRVVAVPNPVLKSLVPLAPEELGFGEDEDFEAFSFWSDSGTPVVFIRADLPPDRFNWALGHELIHLVMHRSTHGDLREAEKEAQDGAKELFMPRRFVLEAFPASGTTVRYVREMARRWNVGFDSFVLRCTELGLLNEGNKRYYIGAFNKGAGELIKRDLPSFYREMCQVLYGKPIRLASLSRDTGASRSFLRDVLMSNGAASSMIEG